jgi:hypothetical protein
LPNTNLLLSTKQSQLSNNNQNNKVDINNIKKIMLKCKRPLPLRRKSFGGQTLGIFWRKTTTTTKVPVKEADEEEQTNGRINNDSSTIDDINDKKTTKTISLDDASSSTDKVCAGIVVGWDDELCRPIYYRRPHSYGNETTCDGDTSTVSGYCGVLDEEVKVEDTNNKRNIDSTFPIPTTRKRVKTFGNRSRHQRPLSLALSQEVCDINDDTEEEEENDEQQHGTPMTTTTETTPNTHQEESRRVSLEFTDSIRSDNNNVDKTRRRSKKRSSSGQLDRARDYFNRLDETQQLTLDSALSPVKTSKITRTRRKTNFTSPGINREYEAYSKSSVSSGVPPLSIKDFASMRKLKTGPIVDGFFDE